MRWQAIQERASQITSYSSLDLTPTGIEEVQTIGDIAERLKSLRNGDDELADFFLEGMKIK